MIKEFEDKYDLSVMRLGKTLTNDYTLKCGRYEKILVYIKEDKVIGFIEYSKLYEVVDILYIVVNEQYRKLGIGTEFIDYISRDLDVKKVMLEVRISNKSAIDFYEKNGFTKIRFIKNYYKDGEDALALEKVV